MAPWLDRGNSLKIKLLRPRAISFGAMDMPEHRSMTWSQ
jgi:hypothetical protein